MGEKRRNLYEGIYIIRASLSSAARAKALDKVKEGITSRGGDILKFHEMGKRRLAYEINRQREGYYYVTYFTIGTQHIADMWREYHFNEDLLRFGTFTTKKVLEKLEFEQLAQSNG
ncbi:30S ribosomal protein S6 [Candidatus Similichlamydia laticola]|uniref:Small ribosomal subunit protein bS6 n=1 Tax=Candidatus Similichlamydia laticola TaxID=2170265 RepID=A0A369KIE4_9BACT|nr:30S ribosomal protein S6 [Candidatus Similichlamydia laticola]RDB31544.1 SSU ribosomal protein S6p [Candidatus Similichlamydia laticola]